MALKRTPLKRGTKKLVTHKPLQSKTALRTGKPVNRTSKRKRQQLAAEEDVRALYLINHPRCEIGMAMLASPDPAIRRVYRSICQVQADACHERLKQSAGGSRTDPDNLMSACNSCNVWVEDNPPLAQALGVSVHPWEDPAEHSVHRDTPVDNAPSE